MFAAMTRSPRVQSLLQIKPTFAASAAPIAQQQTRSIVSRSARNQGVIWVGRHKLPLTEEQHRRQKDKHKPFVLGRDNVRRVDEPIAIPAEALLMKRGACQ